MSSTTNLQTLATLDDLPEVETSLQLCRDELQNEQANGLEVLQLWIEQLLSKYNAQNLPTAQWRMIIACLQAASQQMLEKCRTAAALNNCIDIVKALLQWRCEFATSETHLPIVLHILEYVLQLVLNFINSKEKLDNLSVQLDWQNVNALYLQSLDLVQSILENLHVVGTAEHAQLSAVLELLLQITKVPTNIMGLRYSLKTWECIIHLIVQSATTSTADMRLDAYVMQPINYILSLIEQIMNMLCELQLPVDGIEKIVNRLKLVHFFVLLLQKIVEKYSHNKFPPAAAEQYIAVLRLTLSQPNFVKKHANIKQLLDENLLQPLLGMLANLYQNESIKNLILHGLNDETNFQQSAELTFNYLEISIAARNNVYINENAQFYIEIYKELTKDIGIFLNPAQYELLQQYFIVLTILCHNGSLKQHLVHCVVHEHYIAAHTSAEILMIVSRAIYKRRTSEDFLEEYNFWRECNDNVNILSKHCKRKLFENLLNYFFNLGLASSTLTNKQLLLQHCKSQNKLLHRSNYRFLLTLGLPQVCEVMYANDELPKLIAELQHEIEAIIKCLDANLTMENYEKLFVYIELLNTVQTPPAANCIELLLGLLPKSYEIAQITGNHYLADLTDAIYKMAANHCAAIEAKMLIEMLQLLESQPNTVLNLLLNSVSLLKLLTACTQKCNNLALKTSANRLLERMFANAESAHLKVVQSLLNEEANALDAWTIDNAAYQQMCAQNSSMATLTLANSAQSAKRRRLNDDEVASEPTLKTLIDDICKKSKVIAAKTSSQAMHKDDCEAIKQAIENLSSLLTK